MIFDKESKLLFSQLKVGQNFECPQCGGLILRKVYPIVNAGSNVLFWNKDRPKIIQYGFLLDHHEAHPEKV